MGAGTSKNRNGNGSVDNEGPSTASMQTITDLNGAPFIDGMMEREDMQSQESFGMNGGKASSSRF